ncbi:uncharacterized protein LOC132641680 isoform X1 [Lycium barbarum]|uniref:uncharacterized protein LOC132641680 isoform X1 n=1 Tax=Lycium barbarum TaxID=112863 RepID=UPI00293F0AB4|nr:uncharacterized protein LOC132641680 isoform X1 [Lycium barbarum]XP_060214740.1 uncharacterized protein LOC132641680 isoform X1 [Lycium barbarum]
MSSKKEKAEAFRIAKQEELVISDLKQKLVESNQLQIDLQNKLWVQSAKFSKLESNFHALELKNIKDSGELAQALIDLHQSKHDIHALRKELADKDRELNKKSIALAGNHKKFSEFMGHSKKLCDHSNQLLERKDMYKRQIESMEKDFEDEKQKILSWVVIKVRHDFLKTFNPTPFDNVQALTVVEQNMKETKEILGYDEDESMAKEEMSEEEDDVSTSGEVDLVSGDASILAYEGTVIGEDPKVGDVSGSTPVHIAKDTLSEGTVIGEDPNVGDVPGSTPVQIAKDTLLPFFSTVSSSHV